MKLEHWKIIYGFVLLAGLIILAFGFGLGKVVEQESYGLKEIIIILSMLAGQWGAWAFKDKQDGQK